MLFTSGFIDDVTFSPNRLALRKGDAISVGYVSDRGRE